MLNRRNILRIKYIMKKNHNILLSINITKKMTKNIFNYISYLSCQSFIIIIKENFIFLFFKKKKLYLQNKYIKFCL